MSENQNIKKESWLTELQQKSWEPEVLLSGIVLYGLLQIPDMLDNLVYFMKTDFQSGAGDLGTAVSLLKIAVYWVIAGLILHLVSRGIWIGLVGLNFTFPSGINKQKLKFEGKFEKIPERIPKTEQIILRLEKISSILFSASFFMFMVIFGGYLYFFVTILIPVYTLIFIFDFRPTPTFLNYLNFYVVPVFFIGVIGFIDFVSLGFFKRFRRFSRIYYPIYWWVSIFSLARFYRPIYYTLISNVNRYKLAAVLVAFIVSTTVLLIGEQVSKYPGDRFSSITLWGNDTGLTAFPGYYEDQNTEIKSVQAMIQSDVIKGNTLKLFIVARANHEDSIKKYCNYDALTDSLDRNSEAIALDCLESFYQIALDDSLLTDKRFLYSFNTSTNQRGMLFYIDITKLSTGLHFLEVKPPEEIFPGSTYAEIPFYREQPFAPLEVISPQSDSKEEKSYLQIKPLLPK